MMIKKQLLAYLFFIAAGNTQAEQFQPALTDTQWQNHSSPILCSLTQPIEGFGEAKFS
jgi:hypothetical protein